MVSNVQAASTVGTCSGKEGNDGEDGDGVVARKRG